MRAGRSWAASSSHAPAGLRMMVVLSTLLAFASISTDLYLPALPAMGHDLGSDPGTMEFTISGYLVGFSLGQLLWGPIGDRFGRRGPVVAGLVLFVAGSAGCALSGGAASMIGWRVVQALGACSGVVLARAMVRDLHERDRAAQVLSTLTVIMSVAPLLGPVLGGEILRLFSWRAIFWVLVGIGGATLLAVLTLPETLPPDRRSHRGLPAILRSYRDLLRHRAVLAYALVGGSYYAGVFAYIAATPSLYINYFGLSPLQYALLFAAAVVGIMATNTVNARLVRRLGTDRLLRFGTVCLAASGLAALLAGSTGWGGLPGLAVTLFLFTSTSGLIVANAVAGALAGFPEQAGATAALVGAVHFGCGVVGSALVGALADGSPRPLGWTMAGAGLGALLGARLLLPRPAPLSSIPHASETA